MKSGKTLKGGRTPRQRSTSQSAGKTRALRGDVEGRSQDTAPVMMVAGASGRITYSSPELASLFASLEAVLLKEAVAA